MYKHLCLNYRNKTLQTNALLTLDPNVSGVFSGPYPFGIDPVSDRSLIHIPLHRAVSENVHFPFFFMTSDMEPGSQPLVLPQLIQDEDVRYNRGHPHDLWSRAECLQSLVSLCVVVVVAENLITTMNQIHQFKRTLVFL